MTRKNAGPMLTNAAPTTEILPFRSSRRDALGVTAGALIALVATGALEGEPALAATSPTPASTSTATDFPGVDPTGTSDSTKGLQAWLDSGKAQGFLPAGRYLVTATLHQRKMHVSLDAGATVFAGSRITGPLWTTNDSPTFYAALSLVGGVFDANNLADGGVLMDHFAHFSFRDALVKNALAYGVKVGDRGPNGTAHTSYEAILNNISISNDPGAAFSTSSIGLWVSNAPDSEINDITVVGYGTGVQTDSGAVNLSNVHVWGYENKMPAICFSDNGRGNSFYACVADTPTQYGWRLGSDSTRLVDCRMMQNSTHTIADAAVTGIWVVWPGARHTIVGQLSQGYTGPDGTRRLKADIDGPGIANGLLSQGSTYIGSIAMYVATVRLPSVSGDLVSCKSFVADFPHTSAGDAPFRISRNGVVNVLARTDSPRFEFNNGTMVYGWRGNYANTTFSMNPDTGAIRPGTANGMGASIYSGAGAPTISATKGDIYVNSAGSKGSLLYLCSGGAGWTAVL